LDPTTDLLIAEKGPDTVKLLQGYSHSEDSLVGIPFVENSDSEIDDDSDISRGAVRYDTKGKRLENEIQPYIIECILEILKNRTQGDHKKHYTMQPPKLPPRPASMSRLRYLELITKYTNLETE